MIKRIIAVSYTHLDVYKRQVLVAGYITKGENAKETLIREIKEEVNLNAVSYTHLF